MTLQYFMLTSQYWPPYRKVSVKWWNTFIFVIESLIPLFGIWLSTTDKLSPPLLPLFHIWPNWYGSPGVLSFDNNRSFNPHKCLMTQELSNLAPHPKHHENPKPVTFPCLLKPFWITLEACPLLPRNLHYLSNETFWGVCVCVCVSIHFDSWTKFWVLRVATTVGIVNNERCCFLLHLLNST